MKAHEEHSVRSQHDVLRACVVERIHSVLSQVEPPALRRVMEHGAYGGKMVRPIVTMLSCGAVGGEASAALDAATAIELLHTSSLIHDDIMDESSMRRGVPTTHTMFGIPMAILAGDTFLALAFQLIQSLPSPNKERIGQTFVNSFRTVCEGQGFDLSLTCFDCPEQDAHKRMVEKKTAKLLESASAIGALTGTFNREHIQALSRYGNNLGMAFQAQDDLLDATGDEHAMGKPGRIDERNFKQTFLTLAYSANRLDNKTVGFSAAKNAVAEYTNAAIAALDLLPPTESREMLLFLAESLTNRGE